MCRILFAAVSTILILVTVGSLSPAVADRYCLQGRRWGHPGNCQFSTLQQCRTAASGTHATCGVNPRHAFGRSRQGRQ
ncbi:DUF3551 domain-containing protein [Bradyrhizobium diazoefficiens]|uniref:DUF3551 domain-containing protein n=1 Tax=Bradyrhizobium diazoefficiens TaxID=1355477 RepID=UPI001B5A43ED|nr:hypothetical protein [Bradyrhizobium japonicum]